MERIPSKSMSDRAKKDRLIDSHLSATEPVAKQLYIPPENLLGIAALESDWGNSDFAKNGNNYFGMQYPAPYATGFLLAKKPSKDGRYAKEATFSNYEDAAKSFAQEYGSIIQGISDPKAMAIALQNSGRFGIDMDDGSKKAYYVSDLTSTIKGLRKYISNRKI